MKHIVFRIAKFHSYFILFFTKKVEKLWQSVVIPLMVGIDVLGTRCSTELTALQFSSVILIFMNVICIMFSPSSLHHSIAQVGLLNIFWSIWWKTRFPADAFKISSCPFGCLNCWCNPRIRRFRRNWFCFERSMSIQNGWQCIEELFIKTV